MSGLVYARADAARDFAANLIKAHGFSGEDAAIAAKCLIRADLRGVETHGMLRLPIYLDRVRRGLVNIKPSLNVERPMPAAASLDGDNGLGFIIGTRACDVAIDIASTQGIGFVSVRNSTHFGMAANFILQAVEAGYAALVFTNASRALPPWGGREALLGTGPIAAGVPGGANSSFIFDMSPTVAARGKIRLALKRGDKIPEGWALDADGKATTDPAKALEGIMLPLGGAKGSGIAVMTDVFAGVLSGAGFGGGVRDQNKDFDRPQNVGHFFVVLKPDLFVSKQELTERMDRLAANVRGNPPASGFKEVLMPGDPEARMEAHRKVHGIPYGAAEIADVQKEAAGVKLPPLEISDKAFD